jgi:hypothetical protein
MKNQILKISLFLALFISVNANAQLIINESPKDSVIWKPKSKFASLPKLIHFYGDNDSYTIYYQNAKYTQIRDIKYLTLGDLETTIQFFELLIDVIDNDKEYNIELNGEQWLLKKSMSAVMIYSRSYFYLNKKQIMEIISALK